jgi:glycine cleavage system regulatory protein
VIYLLTVQGKDAIGLVEALAGQVQQRGGNWLESRLCRLGGQFAGIVRVEFPSQPENLPERVETLFCQWDPVAEESAAAPAPSGGSARIEILAADRPGLVKQITHLLTEAGANVEEIESRVRSAPFSGEQMFEARCHISLPAKGDRAKLARQLESLAEELMCDISLEDQREPAAR